jgi:hypothetical protein
MFPVGDHAVIVACHAIQWLSKEETFTKNTTDAVTCPIIIDGVVVAIQGSLL